MIEWYDNNKNKLIKGKKCKLKINFKNSINKCYDFLNLRIDFIYSLTFSHTFTTYLDHINPKHPPPFHRYHQNLLCPQHMSLFFSSLCQIRVARSYELYLEKVFWMSTTAAIHKLKVQVMSVRQHFSALVPISLQPFHLLCKSLCTFRGQFGGPI